MGTKSPTQHFPFLSSPWIRNTLPDYRARRLCPVRPEKKNKPTSTKRVRDRSTRWSNQVPKLTDYHISRYVASTFKRLTKWATHCDLSISGLHRRDLNHEQLFVTPPVNLKFLQYVVELPEPIISRAAGNHIHLDLKNGVMRNHIHLDLKMEYMCGRFHLLYEHLWKIDMNTTKLLSSLRQCMCGITYANRI